MRNTVAAFAVLALLAACDGDPLATGITADPPDPDADPTTPVVDPPVDDTVNENGIPLVIADNLQAIVYDPVAKTLQVTISGLDGTPGAVTYERNLPAEAALPDGYEFYTVQEDPLDRFFASVVRQSFDGSVRGAVAADGGQFRREFSGGWYERDGDFDPPTVGNGPGEGQVTYAGGYVGLDDYTGPAFPLPAGANPVLQPRGPGRVTGSVVINANFADMQLNGAIFDRDAIDDVNGLINLTNLILIVTDIDEDGRFAGTVETTIDGANRIVGDYAGLFGGQNSSSLGAAILIENFVDEDANGNVIDDETETGVLVLTQCGFAGADAALCNRRGDSVTMHPLWRRSTVAALAAGFGLSVAAATGNPTPSATLESETVTVPFDDARVAAVAAGLAGNMPLADTLSTELLKADPNDPDALLAKSTVLLAQSAWDKAYKASKTAFRYTDLEVNRYHAARVAAASAMADKRLMRAQYWLRRAGDYAPRPRATPRA